MLIDFFYKIRAYQVPVTIREFLDLLRAMKAEVIYGSIEDFYSLARITLIKEEKHFDKFDRAFADYFKGIESLDEIMGEVPDEWLKKLAEKNLSDEEKAMIESLGGFEKLMETLKERLEGTSPFGAYGYNPEGVRIGQHESRHRRAVKVWDKREFKNFDDEVEIGTRNMKVALRRLRKFARTGLAEELDLDDTIKSTAANAGYLDIKMRPEKHNRVKVIMFFDVGGSMDDHIRVVEELFSAARSEFKHLEYYYFHNCLYESVWKDNRRRFGERIPTYELLQTFPSDYKLIFVGDATMSPYEITYPGGSVEHWNEEAGAVWLQRALETYSKAIWLNPQPERMWHYHQSIEIVNQVMEKRMFPLTLEGITRGIQALS